MKNSKRLLALAVSAALAAPMAAHATNGMNMESYGPIAGGMGGASMAYDNGAAAMMNNPATLGLMADGQNRIDVAVGVLGPDVAAEAPAAMGGASASSGGDSYVMPAVGWAHRNDKLTYGVGVFAQGGMGTEYSKNTWMAMGTGDDVRSELGVGRLMAPLAFNVNEQLTIGGSIDFVWGGLDMKMAMPIVSPGGATPGTFADFMPAFGGSQVLGEASLTAGLLGQISTAFGAGYDTVALNFSNGSDFTQEANGTGFGGKIGALYKVNQQVTVGASYHLKTAMSDWEGSADMVMYDVDGANPTQSISGSITVKDFQWPATIAAGVAFTPNDRLMVAADIKVLQWSDVMKDFTMEFRPDGTSESATITFYQDWDDQTVFSLGGAYKATDALTVRAGANLSNNPIPDKYVHPLFPAIVKNHYTAGLGYTIDKASDVNFSLAYAPEVSATNSNTGVEITHSQTNYQLMYSYRF